MMKNNLLKIVFLVLSMPSIVFSIESFNASNIIICQDQAENFGNGLGEDFVDKSCLTSFKNLASKKSIVAATQLKMKFLGYKNMILVEKIKNNLMETEIIAGNSTELKSIQAIVVDQKNQEIIVLEDTGDVLFFTTTLTGNIAPYRILKHNELLGASEIALDNLLDQVIIYNKKSEKIFFFSRLANVHAPKDKQKLQILNSINTTKFNFTDMSFDSTKREIIGTDLNLNQKVSFPLDKIK